MSFSLKIETKKVFGSLKYAFIFLLMTSGFFYSEFGVALAQDSISFGNGTQLDLYLLIGQSNMAGRAPINQAQRVTLKNVYLFTNDSWVHAANPLNKYSTVRKRLSMQKLGPGYSFAKKLSKCTEKKIGLIVNARGGTRIEWWQKGYKGPYDYNLYEQAVEQTKKAQQYGKLKGILWLQGAGDQSRADTYMFYLKKLVQSLRNDLGKKVYFVAGQIGKWRESSAAINRVIRLVPREIDNAGYVSSDGLKPLHGDANNPHFNTKSQVILGKRYADNIWNRIYHISSCDQY